MQVNLPNPFFLKPSYFLSLPNLAKCMIIIFKMSTLRCRKFDAELWFRPAYDSKIYILSVSIQANLLGRQGGDTGLALLGPSPHFLKATPRPTVFL